MAEHQYLCVAEVVTLKSSCALGVGEHITASDHSNAFGKLATLPPSIEQRRNSAGHDDGHVRDNPVGRVTSRDTDPVTFLNASPFNQPACELARSRVALGKGQATIAIDEEFLVGIRCTKICEIICEVARSLG